MQRFSAVFVDPFAASSASAGAGAGGGHKVKTFGSTGWRTKPDLLVGRLSIDHIGAVGLAQIDR